MMFGQTVGSENKRKSRIAGWRKPVVLTSKPVHYRIRVPRIKGITHRRLQRFVMGRDRSILQTFRYVQPAKTILVQNERRIPRNAVKPGFVARWTKLGRFFRHKIGHVDASP